MICDKKNGLTNICKKNNDSLHIVIMGEFNAHCTLQNPNEVIELC